MSSPSRPPSGRHFRESEDTPAQASGEGPTFWFQYSMDECRGLPDLLRTTRALSDVVLREPGPRSVDRSDGLPGTRPIEAFTPPLRSREGATMALQQRLDAMSPPAQRGTTSKRVGWG
jgi:hypothetical protein